jgi:hypothetical protein
MKIEKRGKYPGVKVHLDPEECEAFLQFAEDVAKSALPVPTNTLLVQDTFFSVSLKIGKKMLKLRDEAPNFLKERTPLEIEQALLKDKQKIEQQLQAGIANGAWKQVD